ncbi:AAA family ATPase [Oscillospiraceae bacterium 44-34]
MFCNCFSVAYKQIFRADVFKSVSITSDENIPINKRGSGSKRLILLNFFRAEVERRQGEVNATSPSSRETSCSKVFRYPASAQKR